MPIPKQPNKPDPAMMTIRATRGLSAEIARACNVHRVAVYKWMRVPAHHAHRVSEVTGFALSFIRPDLFKKRGA